MYRIWAIKIQLNLVFSCRIPSEDGAPWTHAPPTEAPLLTYGRGVPELVWGSPRVHLDEAVPSHVYFLRGLGALRKEPSLREEEGG